MSVSAVAVTLTGCSVISAFTPHVDSAIYADAKEFAASTTSAFGSPTFIPDDATTIRVDYDTQGTGAILTYTSATHFKAGMCTAAAKVKKPDIQDSWWPVTPPADGVSCPGGWTAFNVGDQIYATVLTSAKK